MIGNWIDFIFVNKQQKNKKKGWVSFLANLYVLSGLFYH